MLDGNRLSPYYMSHCNYSVRLFPVKKIVQGHHTSLFFLLIPPNRVPMTCSGRKKKISSNSEAGISHQTNARKRIPDAAPFLKALVVVSIANCVRWSI